MSNPPVRDFFELVKAIGESKSKQEEDRIVTEEVAYLKKIVPEKGTKNKKLKEIVVRAMYVEMLGQDASFAYIKAVELCASTNIIQKRVGYLASALCLSPDHEFRFMLVNQIQRDMNSSNQLESCAALSAVSKIVTEDMIPAVIGDVVKLLTHDMDIVRKKAISALHRLYQMDKSCVVDHIDKIRRMLCDKDPAVMGAALPLIIGLAQDSPSSLKDLVPSLVSILKQITEHRLPRDFDYHRIPAPWIQMHLLKLLAILGRGDQTSSEGMYEVLVDVMRRADTGINVGYALVYQAVHTVTSIYPNPILLDAAATSISRFIRSDSHNLKYIGIKGLATIVKDHPKYAADHQMAVIDCLEDPDETLKRKTLDLLFRMTNSVNVEFIVEKLLSFLANATDDHFRTDLVGQITQCAERFAPSNAWYVQTMVKVFECAGDKVKLSVAQTLVQLIAEGQDDPEEGEEDEMNSDDELRMEAVEDFLDLIDKPKLPEILAQAMAWILGEYGYLSESCNKEQIMEKLCNLAYRTVDFNTRGHVITAVMKLVAQNGSCPLRVTKMITHFSISSSLDVQQRCLEFKELLIASEYMADALPVDASCEDIDIDENLSFLNDYVQSSLNRGAKSYCLPESMIDEVDVQIDTKSFNITPYAMPSIPTVSVSNIMSGLGGSAQTGPTHIASSSTTPQTTVAAVASQGNQLLNTRGVAAVWGPKAVVPEVVVTPPTPPPQVKNLSPTIEVSSPNIFVAPIVAKEIIRPEPEKPRELSEREKMAASLFGGVSTTKTATRRSSTKSVTTPVVPVFKQENLLETSSPVLAPQVNTSSKVSNDLDIFADMNDMITSPNNISNNINNNNLNDIFADMSVGGVPVQLQQQHTNSQPLALTTSEFGQKWGGTPCEMKQFSLSKNITNLEQLRRGMPVNLSHVESIQSSGEAIFAAKSITGTVILIHIKLAVQKQGCDITVKASSKDLCLGEIESISMKISNF